MIELDPNRTQWHITPTTTDNKVSPPHSVPGPICQDGKATHALQHLSRSTPRSASSPRTIISFAAPPAGVRKRSSPSSTASSRRRRSPSEPLSRPRAAWIEITVALAIWPSVRVPVLSMITVSNREVDSRTSSPLTTMPSWRVVRGLPGRPPGRPGPRHTVRG